VRMSLVKAQHNPITGALVVADVVAQPHVGRTDKTCETTTDTTVLKGQILETCRQALPPYKVPAAIRLVASIELRGSGKLARR
jgi:acyl-CoA synthetase (AMP-forming)/AMP-acid ligase II